MRDRFGLIFVVLVACGTLCILGSLAVLGLLFNSHAEAMSVPNQGGPPMSRYAANFLFFVVVPARRRDRRQAARSGLSGCDGIQTPLAWNAS